MPQIAVDVVLLPSEEMMEKAIEANKELLNQYSDRIVLDKKSCLPHISLAMGCIDKKNVPDIEMILENIVKEHSIRFLYATSIHVQQNPYGEKISVLEVKNTNQLQSLHEQLMRKLAQFFSYDVRAEMLFGNEPIRESTLLWIKNYPEKSSYGNFFPHITLGYGRIEITGLPLKFAASKLALCHLGNHCTCKKVLTAAEFAT